MSTSLVVEILLGLLSLAVGGGSYLGSTRAERRRSAEAQASIDAKDKEIDAEAYDRAKDIYLSAIESLKGHIGDLREQIDLLAREKDQHIAKLREQIDLLDAEVVKLRKANVDLRVAMTEMQVANTRLELEIKTLREQHE